MLKVILIKLLFCCVVLCTCSNLYAKEVDTAVLLNFSDNTEYKELNTDEIIEQLLLDKLLELEGLYIYEHTVTKETLNIEKDLVGNKEKVASAIDEKNFTVLFKKSIDDITFKNQGDYLSNTKTSLIGEKYGAKYIIHGTVDYIGGKERGRKIVWDDFRYDHRSNIITVLSTLKVIEADTGKIIWCIREKGSVKDRFDSLNNFSYGTKEFSNHLFFEALDEISEKMVRKLRKDIDKGVFKLST